MKTSPRDRCAGKARRTSRCGGTATAQGGSITFHAKLAARSSNASTDVIAATVARREVEGELSDLGNYVNIVAGVDPVIVDASGFPSYSTTRVADFSAPAAPTDLRLRQGDLSGSAIALYQAGRSNSMGQVQNCIGDPNVEANWKDAGMFSGAKASRHDRLGPRPHRRAKRHHGRLE